MHDEPCICGHQEDEHGARGGECKVKDCLCGCYEVEEE